MTKGVMLIVHPPINRCFAACRLAQWPAPTPRAAAVSRWRSRCRHPDRFAMRTARAHQHSARLALRPLRKRRSSSVRLVSVRPLRGRLRVLPQVSRDGAHQLLHPPCARDDAASVRAARSAAFLGRGTVRRSGGGCPGSPPGGAGPKRTARLGRMRGRENRDVVSRHRCRLGGRLASWPRHA